MLSGGGSRGLVHTGVLMGLERLGRDPEIVVGTSFGALVGALYAAGYEPEEIVRELEAAEWAKISAPIPLLLGPDRVVRYPVLTADVSVDPLRSSRGFIPQWRINRMLVRLLFEANARIRGGFDLNVDSVRWRPTPRGAPPQLMQILPGGKKKVIHSNVVPVDATRNADMNGKPRRG